jgi:uncharacterized protein YdaU (DUF1376 family)
MVVSEFHTGSVATTTTTTTTTNQSKTHVRTIGRYTHSDRSQYEFAMVRFFLLHCGWKQKRKESVIYPNEMSNIHHNHRQPLQVTTTLNKKQRRTQTRTANELITYHSTHSLLVIHDSYVPTGTTGNR